MGWYEAIKDGIVAAQKADNIPLVTQLIEAQKQILDLIHENTSFKEEIKQLKAKEDICSNILRHKDAYITLKSDEQGLIYCSNCWDTQEQLVQTQINENGTYFCPACKNNGYYDRAKYDSIHSSAMSSLYSNNFRG